MESMISIVCFKELPEMELIEGSDVTCSHCDNPFVYHREYQAKVVLEHRKQKQEE